MKIDCSCSNAAAFCCELLGIMEDIFFEKRLCPWFEGGRMDGDWSEQGGAVVEEI